MEIEIRLLCIGGWRQGGIQSNCQWVHRISSGGDENVLEIEVVVAHHGECTKCLWIVHFKIVILCAFHNLKKNNSEPKCMGIPKLIYKLVFNTVTSILEDASGAFTY